MRGCSDGASTAAVLGSNSSAALEVTPTPTPHPHPTPHLSHDSM
jgi:hypothetical protein